MSEFCLRRQLKTRSLAPRMLCRTAHYLRKYTQWETLMMVVRAVRKLCISNAVSGNQEVQSLRNFHGTILGRFSNNAAVAMPGSPFGGTDQL
jgi:hypothetical protein